MESDGCCEISGMSMGRPVCARARETTLTLSREI